MKINLAKSAGFCFGVRRALNIAFNAVESDTKIQMLGDIVHNEDVVKTIQSLGIKKIKKLAKVQNKTLLIRAHGMPLETFKKAQRLGYKIIDATCPMVKEIHKTAKDAELRGHRIIVIGDKNHDEVKGIIGQLKNKAIVIDKPKNIPLKKIKMIKKTAVVVQSTQNIENAFEIVRKLKKYIKNLRFFNTICRPTRTKQQEIRIMPLKNDIMIVIGSKTSANTKRLYEISKSLNRKTFWIQSKNDIKPRWFRDTKSIGITAGASTPDYTTKKVIEFIKGKL